MKKIIIMFISVILLLSGCSGCLYGILHPFRQDGPYKGKIIDADTGQPIEGVVVLGTWFKVYPNVAGSTHEFYDASEVVTDKNGEFLIRGLGLKVFSNVEAMNILIFKSGYEYFGTMPWVTLKIDSTMQQKVKWEDGKVIISLIKLTLEERIKQHADKETIPDGKQRLLIQEVNKERKYLGLSLYPEVN